MKRTSVQATIPGPPSRFGRYAETLFFFSDPIGYMDKLFAQYGQVVGVLTAPLTTPPAPDYPGTVFVYGPDLLRAVSTNHDGYHRSAMSHRLYPAGKVTPRTDPLRRIMTGLAYQRGDTHRLHRRLILPALHKHKVKTYFDDMVAETQRLLDEWQVGGTYDMKHEMVKLTLRISARSLFGQTDQAEGERIGRLIDQWVDFIMSVGHLFPIDLPGIPYRKWLDLSREVEIGTRRIIADKRSSGADDGSLLSMLIHATDEDGTAFSEDDLVGHISLMLWGSRDAVAAALTWTLFLISLHADVHEGVVRELDSTLSGSPPSVDQLTQLPVTANMLKETLRILPPFPGINRVAAGDQRLGNYEIPDRSEFILSVYRTHRMPELYDQPTAFRPERWETIEPQLFEFVPFGGGPRMCPGTNFTWQELLVVTSMLLQRYRVEIVDNARVDRVVRLGLMPKQALNMRVHAQDQEFSRSVKPVRGDLNDMVSTLPQ